MSASFDGVIAGPMLLLHSTTPRVAVTRLKRWSVRGSNPPQQVTITPNQHFDNPV